ncbi:MAG: hypothetical protein A2Z99_12375 [Treponema sp. GWB1_62_6]|nr:MAG: hypothetical protein A2Y36_02280 [Treponema sp. GWA1_62_8]OHE63419.1 MAG: hypothetical protein A2Z99_12375 [Treponema sp. GWB1_62_6]OHE66274.1 MAG: hypothetical protein A2001_06700 [Treponema sp. GWC1_61_84]OHE72636.1 MAG: hypothetical protein A2413_04950 [Treponema sp. RIFOXYC1_FULL_61_9]HCM28979.1 hypothetical protein [Treponema sp.]
MTAPPPLQYYVYLACAAILVLALLPTAYYAWRSRVSDTAGGAKLELSRFLVFSIGYLIVNSLEILWQTDAGTLFFASLCYLFLTALPTGWFLFALEHSGKHALARRLRPFLWIVPFASLAVVFTNSWHRLHWAEWTFFRTGPFVAMSALSYGPLFWGLYFYLQFLVFGGVAFVIGALFRTARALNRQSAIVAMGALVPVAFNIAYVLRLIPGLQKDFSSVSFALAGIIFTVGVYHDRLFDLAPIAKRALVDALADPLIAVDGDGRIVAANSAACRVCGLPEDPSGKTAADGSAFLAAVMSAIAGSAGGSCELSPDGEVWYEVRVADVPAKGRRLNLYSMRDVTERRRLLDEKTALVERLSRAMEDLRTVQGIIPICASCKKVRDDSGYWQQVESYVATLTGAEFSHGLCPDCRGRLYPEFMNKITSEGGTDDGSP